jgi:hypothetical protein
MANTVLKPTTDTLLCRYLDYRFLIKKQSMIRALLRQIKTKIGQALET